MRNYKQRIRLLLEHRPELRDNDRLLTLALWDQYGLHLTEAQKALFMKVPQAEVISRRRREMREEFPESEAVQESRYQHFKEFKEELTPEPPQYKAVSWLED